MEALNGGAIPATGALNGRGSLDEQVVGSLVWHDGEKSRAKGARSIRIGIDVHRSDTLRTDIDESESVSEKLATKCPGLCTRHLGKSAVVVGPENSVSNEA